MSGRLRFLPLVLLPLIACVPDGPDPTPDHVPQAPPEPARPTWPATTPVFTTAAARAALPASTVAAIALHPDLGAVGTSTGARLLDAVGAVLDLPRFALPLRSGAPAIVGWSDFEASAWFAVLPVDDVPTALRQLAARPAKKPRGTSTSTLTPGVSWLRVEGHLVATPSGHARALSRALEAPRASLAPLAPLFEKLAFGAAASGFVHPPKDSDWPFGDVVFGIDPGPEHLLAKVVIATSSAAAAEPLELDAVPWTHTATPAVFAALRTSEALVGQWARFALGLDAKRWTSSLVRPPWSEDAQASLTGAAVAVWRGKRYGRHVAVEARDLQALTATAARPPRHLDHDGPWLTLNRPERSGRAFWAGWSPEAQRLLPTDATGAFVALRPVTLASPSPLQGLLGQDIGHLGILGLMGGGKKHARVMEKMRAVRKERDATRSAHRRTRRDASQAALEALGYLVGFGEVEDGAWVIRGGFTGANLQSGLQTVLANLGRARPKTADLARIAALNARLDRLHRRASKLSSAHITGLFGSAAKADWGSSIGSEGLIGLGSRGAGGLGGGRGIGIGSGGGLGGGGGEGRGYGRIGGFGTTGRGGGGGGVVDLGRRGRRPPRAKLTVELAGVPPEIRTFVLRKLGRLRRCYQSATEGSALGILQVELTVDEAGTVAVAKTTGPAQPKVGACVRRALRGRLTGVGAGQHFVSLRYAK